MMDQDCAVCSSEFGSLELFQDQDGDDVVVDNYLKKSEVNYDNQRYPEKYSCIGANSSFRLQFKQEE